VILRLAIPILLLVAAIDGFCDEKAESDAAAFARVRSEIDTLIGTARCGNLVHCRLLPLGRNACGNPADYLAYSTRVTDPTLLETKASEYTFLQEEAQIQQSNVTGCTKLAEPIAACIDNHCRVQPASK
jgi:hypothetical protein